MQIFAANPSTPHTGGKLMGKHLSTRGSTRGLRVLVVVVGMPYAYDSGNNLYANAYADTKCPAARKQETNYAREAVMKFHKAGKRAHQHQQQQQQEYLLSGQEQ